MADLKNLLDVGSTKVFEFVPTQTGDGCRRSLLEMQHLVRGQLKSYVYLEIGSFLGGTLVPHLVDPSCKCIFSIDARVVAAPNEGSETESIYGEQSSSEMCERLRTLTGDAVEKLKCFDCDMRDVNPRLLTELVDLAFIDGEHTDTAVFSDFCALEDFLSLRAVVVFHDYWCIKNGVDRILEKLRLQGKQVRAVKLEGEVFVIFLDPRVSRRSTYVQHHIWRWRKTRVRRWIRSRSPGWLIRLYRRACK